MIELLRQLLGIDNEKDGNLKSAKPERETNSFSQEELITPERIPLPSVHSGTDNQAEWENWAKKRRAQQKTIVGRKNGYLTLDGLDPDEFRTYFLAMVVEMNTDSSELLQYLIDYSFGFGIDSRFSSLLPKVMARAADENFLEEVEKVISSCVEIEEDLLDLLLLQGAVFRNDLQRAGIYLERLEKNSTFEGIYSSFLDMKMLYEAGRGQYSSAIKIGEEIIDIHKSKTPGSRSRQWGNPMLEQSSGYIDASVLVKIIEYIQNPQEELKDQINYLLRLPGAGDLTFLSYGLMVMGRLDLIESDLFEPVSQKRFIQSVQTEKTAALLQHLVDQASASEQPLDLKKLNDHLKKIEQYENMRGSYYRAAFFFKAHNMEKEARKYFKKTAQLPCNSQMSPREVRSDVNQRFNALDELGYKEATVKKDLRETEKELAGNQEGLIELEIIRKFWQEEQDS